MSNTNEKAQSQEGWVEVLPDGSNLPDENDYSVIYQLGKIENGVIVGNPGCRLHPYDFRHIHLSKKWTHFRALERHLKNLEDQINNFNPVKYYLEKNLEDKEVHLWDEELERVIQYANDIRSFRNNRGIRYSRIETNPREKAFAYKWMLENIPNPGLNFGGGTLADLFCDRGKTSISAPVMNEKITDRDRMIVATVIQWLGSNCGLAFLEETVKEFNYRLRPIEHDEAILSRNSQLESGLKQCQHDRDELQKENDILKEKCKAYEEALQNIGNQHHSGGLVTYNGVFMYLPTYAQKIIEEQALNIKES